MSTTFIDFYKNLPKGDTETGKQEVTYHPRLSGNNKVTEKELTAQVSERIGLSQAVVMSVLQGLTDQLVEQLKQGNQVNVDGIGSFALALGVKEPIYEKTPRKPEKVMVTGVNFRPAKGLLQAASQTHFARTKNPIHSTALTEEVIMERLKAYLDEHHFIQHRSFQDLMHQSRSTSYRLLKRLMENGTLVRMGTSFSPYYVAGENLLK
jgi:predicted histone-like DNA-binding protein